MLCSYWSDVRRSRSLKLTAALALTLLGSAVRADSQPTAADRETARALMEEGDQLIAKGELPAALTRYTAAHALVHIPTTGLEVARTQVKLGLLVEARGLALEIANSPATSGEPRVFSSARSAAAQLAQELAPRIPSLRTEVTPATVGYSLTIDGVTLPSAARTIAYRTNPGPHVIVVAAPGYVSQRKELKLKEREAATLPIALTPAPPNSAVTKPAAGAPNNRR